MTIRVCYQGRRINLILGGQLKIAVISQKMKQNTFYYSAPVTNMIISAAISENQTKPAWQKQGIYCREEGQAAPGCCGGLNRTPSSPARPWEQKTVVHTNSGQKNPRGLLGCLGLPLELICTGVWGQRRLSMSSLAIPGPVPVARGREPSGKCQLISVAVTKRRQYRAGSFHAKPPHILILPLWTELRPPLSSPKNSYVEALSPSVILHGDRAF